MGGERGKKGGTEEGGKIKQKQGARKKLKIEQ